MCTKSYSIRYEISIGFFRPENHSLAGSSSKNSSSVASKLKIILDEPLEITEIHNFRDVENEISELLKYPLDVQGQHEITKFVV